MALPQKAIDQLSREPAQTPGWSSRLLMWSGTLFFIVIATFFGVRYGYQPYLSNQLEEVIGEIEKFTQQTPADEQAKILTFYSQLVNLRKLLVEQKLASEVLPWFEQYTHSNVVLHSLDVDLVNGSVTFSAEGNTLRDVAEQIAALQQLPDVKEFEFSGASRDTNGVWQFSVTLSLNTQLFRSGGTLAVIGE